MSLIRGALRGLMILGVSAVWSGAAAAQDEPPPEPPTPRQVVEHCLSEMAQITETTVGAIRHRAHHGIGAIVQLSQNDASPRRIIFAGEVAKASCTLAAARGQHALDETLRRCVFALEQLQAPPEAFRVVHEGRRRSGHEIGDALALAKQRVNQAVMRALESIGDEPGGGDEAAPIVSAGAILLTP